MEAKEEAENREGRKGIGMIEEWPTRCDEVEIDVAVKAVMFFLSLRVFFFPLPLSFLCTFDFFFFYSKYMDLPTFFSLGFAISTSVLICL